MNLYHYTSEAGFNGIVLNNIMRLTLSTQSNDEKDTIYIYDLIKENKDKLYIDNMPEHNMIIDGLLESFTKFEERIKSNNFDDQLLKPFVLCFTDKGDDKDMWEGYNKNVGYSIEIDINSLEQYTKTVKFANQIIQNANSYVMTPVIYDKDTQISIIKDIIDSEYNKFLNNKDEKVCDTIDPIQISYNFKITFTDLEDDDYSYESEPKYARIQLKNKFIDLLDSIYSQLLLVAPLIKNPYWKSENETRLMFLRKLKDSALQDINTNEKGNYYIDFKIDKTLIKKIIIGPLNDININEVKNKLIKANYDIDKILVEDSSGKGVLRKR